MSGPPLVIAVVCPGLDHVQRGYETFSQALARFLREHEMPTVLVKGSGGHTADEIAVRALRRDGRAAAAVVGLFGRRSVRTPHDGARGSLRPGQLFVRLATLKLPVSTYEVEQATFALGLVATLRDFAPDLVIVHDVVVARLLHRVRRRFLPNTRILFVNGAPWPPPYDFADVVQHLTTPSYEQALGAGEPPARNVVLSPALPIQEFFVPRDKSSARRTLGLPMDGCLILSVGALNFRHKRHDHLISSVAALPVGHRPHVAIVGADDAESAEVKSMAARLLGSGATVATAEPSAVPTWYEAADVVVQASTFEGFGLVYVEAAARGLPVVAHDAAVPRYVLGAQGIYVDMGDDSELSEAIAESIWSDSDESERRRHRDMYERFSWDRLAESYLELVRTAASAEFR